jgi:hypothetical protein
MIAHMSEPTTPEPAPLKCFVIMPFTDTTHANGTENVTIVADQWRHIYNNWLRKAVESYTGRRIECKCSEAAPGNFIKGIIQDLDSHHLVLADLTGSRPNVYYELGIRHALRTGTIIITQTSASVPSDLRNYYCFQYTYTDKSFEYEDAFARFKKEMHEKIASVLKSNFGSDSPVSDFLTTQRYSEALHFSQRKQGLIDALQALCATLIESEANALKLAEIDINDPQNIHPALSGLFDVSLIDAIYTRLLLGFDWTHFPPEMRSAVLGYIKQVRERVHRLGHISQRLSDEINHEQRTSIKELCGLLGGKPLFSEFCDQLIHRLKLIKAPSA